MLSAFRFWVVCSITAWPRNTENREPNPPSPEKRTGYDIREEEHIIPVGTLFNVNLVSYKGVPMNALLGIPYDIILQ